MRRALPVCVLLAACHQSPAEPSTAGPSPPPPALPATPAVPGAGMPHGAHAPTLAWTDPTGWRRVTPSSPMRTAQYVIPFSPGAPPGPGDAELTVFYFGQGQGGSVDDNLQRWYSQLTQPDGRATRDAATREVRTVGSLHVTVTYVTGRTTGGAMPGMPAVPARDNQALLGAIAETPTGPWFFKVAGPQTTVAAARPAFDDLVRSMHVE